MPRFRFHIPAVPAGVHPRLGNLSLRLADGTEVPRGFISESQHTSDEKGYRSNLSGIIGQRVLRPKDAAVKYALFLLPNFDSPNGHGLSYPDQSERSARLLLVADGWRVVLDNVGNLKEVKAALDANSGFGVTQVGRVEREDGSLFTAGDAIAILDALGWYISFACGRWTGPCNVKGFDAGGTEVWELWDHRRVVPYHKRRTWMDSCHHEHFELPFPGFFKLWQNDTWEEITQHAIHWYIEANSQAGSVEGSIVLTLQR